MLCNHSKAEQQEIISFGSMLNVWFPFWAAYVFVSLQMWSMSLVIVKSLNKVTRESCRSRIGSGKVYRLKSSAFWMSLCCHRFKWIPFASFTFFFAGSFSISNFFQSFCFFWPSVKTLVGLSFVWLGFHLSLHLSPQVTQEQEVDFHLDYQHLDPLRHLNQRHCYFILINRWLNKDFRYVLMFYLQIWIIFWTIRNF